MLGSQSFGGTLITGVEEETGETKQYLDDISLFGDSIPPDPSDRGLIDTAIVEAREMIRITATFDKPGTYVWHCHMLIHEDHDMMRPFEVISPWEAARNGNDAFTGGRGTLIADDESDELLPGGSNALTTEVLSDGTNEADIPADFTFISEEQLLPLGDDGNPLSEEELLSIDNDSDLLPTIVEDI